ncbi:hypothetical protein [Haloarcula sp. Atlit-7R]|uniref:hypothetical protein n=1 Tax=Haloarcula sp. Atlit-7R TaxID=2282125 RepID=UPI0011C412F6|nr:hypothetical protein [Haloarcula sp. Atlit-7R]
MTSDVNDEFVPDDFEAVFGSLGFQKTLVYQQLDDGIEAIINHERLFESLVSAVTNQHSQVDSQDVTREFVTALHHEVRAHTESLDSDTAKRIQTRALNQCQTTRVAASDTTGAAGTVEDYLAGRLEQEDVLQVQSRTIAESVGLKSRHVGQILGMWRNSDDAPFDVTASETAGEGNLWTIQHSTG